jgi:hypothetical protein
MIYVRMHGMQDKNFCVDFLHLSDIKISQTFQGCLDKENKYYLISLTYTY